jgi:hypothetical protein
MAQPVWTTPAGSLGTYPQDIFLNPIQLEVLEPSGAEVYFKVIAGALPSGIECSDTGILQGVPTNVVTVAQITTTINEADVISKFTIRAYTTRTVSGIRLTDRLMDRTFTMTIAGQTQPRWITPPGSLGGFLMGTLLEDLQLEYAGANPSGIPPAISLISGRLPPGITLTNTGLLSGFFALNEPVEATPGFSVDGQGYDQYEFDFTAQAESYNYQFTLRVTDGRTSALQTFSMFVQSPDIFNASTTVLTADDTFFDASASNVQVPVILNPQGTIGSVPATTFFAYQFIGATVYNTRVGFVGYDLPPGLELDTISGWLYGYLPDIGLTAQSYDFTIKVYLYDEPSAPLSEAYAYSLLVEGPISANVTWITPSDLGEITNGTVSNLYVEAVSTSDLTLQYRLLSGSNSRLPQGLTLLPSGNIVGRTGFTGFILDGGATTFDVDTGKPTTFDLTYTFTVNAYSLNGYVSVNQTFTINVINEYDVPFKNLYIQCMPPQNDRQLINSLLQNPSIFPPNLLYRSDDPNFGLSKNVVYYHAYGLAPTSINDYIAALQINHYWKNLILGPIETAQARDPVTNEVVYEVVYSRIVDNLVDNQGKSVDKEVVLAYPALTGNSNNMTGQNISVVYPNSLENMRDQVIDTVGQESDMLPTWMLSKQSDGTVPGFTPAWVIAYTKPGASGQIAYNIQTQFGLQLNLVDFKVDRYELDNSMAYNWDTNTQEWIPTPSESTTFDIDYNYSLAGLQQPFDTTYFDSPYLSPTEAALLANDPTNPGLFDYDIVGILDGGSGYRVGDTLRILGSQLGGINGINDLIIQVNTVTEPGGAIVDAFYTGKSSILNNGAVFNNISSIPGPGVTGIGAQWLVTVVPGVPTVFDGGSVEFTNPANMNANTNVFDQYLMFPRINVLSPVSTFYVVWKNTNNSTISWINTVEVAIPWTSSNA